MNRAGLLREVLLGRLLIVGEFRGAHAAMDGYVDRTTGEKVGYVKAIILAECQVRGNLARAMFYQRLPESVEKPEEAVFPYQKGKLYVFFLVSLKNDNRQVIGSLADRLPELLEDQPEASSDAATQKELAEISAVTEDSPDRQNRIRVRAVKRRIGRKFDYAAREAINRSLGEKGEQWVLLYETKRLQCAGLAELVPRIDWVSKSMGDGVGYDIRSFNSDGTERFIEVKTTNQGKFSPFFLSNNEIEFADEFTEQFYLYRVFDFRDSPRVFILHGKPFTWGTIQPVQFRVSF